MLEVPVRMAYWLVPAEPALLELKKIVCTLADKYHGPKFEPHATIYHGAHDVSDPVSEILEKLSAFGELELFTKSLNFAEKFTQSCFIEFENSFALKEMYQMVRSQIHIVENHPVVPHMSLFYGALNEEQRKDILKEVSLPSSVKFTVVKAIANRARVTSREDVEYWNERAVRELAV